MIEKLLGAAAGEEVTIIPDLVLVTNGPSYKASELAERVALRDRMLVMYDHNVPSGSPEDARVFGVILRFAKKFELKFKQAKGVALDYVKDEILAPGQVMIAGTRHASVMGAKGALGIGISNVELARVIENGKYHAIVPQTVTVKVTGALEGAGNIDAALTFLAKAGDIAGKVVEFSGQVDEHLKEVLCYMACDTGAYTALWGDAETADMELDLSEVKPMLRLPVAAAEDQIKAGFAEASILDGVKIEAGQIGGVNGGSIEDLRKAAAMIEGKKLKYGFRLTVCPSTSEDYLKAIEEGIITKFVDFNAQISAAGDHSVVPQGAGAAGPKEKLITTGLYTYAGCMGCADAEVYTASVETIIAAALA